MKSNIHKKLTEEDKFGRKYYCKHTRLGVLRSDKKKQSKTMRFIGKKECITPNE